MLKKFAVFYEAGMAGTWLAWFVNLHANFPKAELNNEYQYEDDVLTDYSSNGSNWTTHLDHENEPTYNSDTYLKIEDQYATHCNHGSRLSRPDSLKWCCKLLPDHAMNMCSDELFDHVISQLDAAIIPYVENDFVEPLAARYEYIRPEWYTAPEFNHTLRLHEIRGEVLGTLPDDNRHVIHYNRIKNAMPTLPVDIGKLFTLNEDEYTKLLEFINEDPLPDWKDLVKSTVDPIYSRFY